MPNSGSLDFKGGTPIAVLFVTNHFRSPKMIKFESTRLSRVKNHVGSLTQGEHWHQSSEAALAGPVTVQDVLKCTVLVACQSPRNLATGRKGAGLPLPSKVLLLFTLAPRHRDGPFRVLRSRSPGGPRPKRVPVNLN